ncbi:LuxR family transcriptional regulator [Azospirillum sp. sgz302134]
MTERLTPEFCGFSDVLEIVSSAKDIDGLKTSTRALLENLGFSLVTYHMIKAGGLPQPLAIYFSNYPAAWVSHYINNRLFFVDPVVRRAQESISPFAWDGLAAGGMDHPDSRFFEQAADHGVRHGVSIPIHGPQDFALFSVCASELSHAEANRVLSWTKPFLTMAALSIHERARAIYQPDVFAAAGVSELSRRETEVMQWVACGKSSWDISRILGLSESTIRHCVGNALRKLNCHDRTQAAVRAVLLGLIEAPG